MANPLDDFLSGKTDRKPFSMTDYEAIPLENRQKYVETTSMPAKNQSSEVLNVEGIVSPKAPVSPTLPKLKEMFSTQPVAEQPQQPTYTPPVATSDLVDMEKIRGQVDGMMPERGMSDWLSVLAPLATEAIFGGGKAGGVSYGIAGKAATDIVGKDEARRSKLEDKLMDIERARAIAGAKSKSKDGLVEVDVEGKPIFKRESGAEGLQAWKKPELAGINRGEIAALGREQALKLADRAAITQARDKLIGNKNFQSARSRFYATNDAIDVLNQRNAIGDAGVQILFAKGIFGEVGNLTAQEQAKFIGTPELTTAFNRMITKYKKGTLDETDRGMLLKLASHMRERSKKVAGEVASGYTEGLKSLGIDPSGVVTPLLGGSDIAPEYQLDEVQRIGKDGKTYTYKLNPKTGKYE
jgi:uncharacterized membrane protein